MKFIVDNPNDIIQHYHAKGEFFAIDELLMIKKFCKPNSIILDIGANVGNHAVFFSKYLNAKTIYVIEPVRRSYMLLLANLCINYCHNVNVDYIGLAFGHIQATGWAKMIYKNNLGSARLFYNNEYGKEFEELGEIQVIPGDMIFANKQIDFIKLDVEEMEIVVLQGLKKTIEKNKPRMHVEVLNNNEDQFHEWVKANDYVIVRNHADQKEHYINYLIAHKSDEV